MKKTQKETTGQIVTIKLHCDVCDKDFEVPFSKYDFSASESECGLCGSHGYIHISKECPHCKQYLTIKIEEW